MKAAACESRRAEKPLTRPLIAIPVYNEEKSIGRVLDAVSGLGLDTLVVNDGSKDGTPAVLAQYPAVAVASHAVNRGYGAALRTSFDYAVEHRYDAVVTLDSDGQHDPTLIPAIVDALRHADIVSGSRYLREFPENTPAPMERRRINMLVTDELNAALGLELTDAFCGFKAYRTRALQKIKLREPGYGMPLELWIKAVCHRLVIREFAVPRVYLDLNRSFGESLDDHNRRLAYYQQVIDAAYAEVRQSHNCGMRATRVPTLV